MVAALDAADDAKSTVVAASSTITLSRSKPGPSDIVAIRLTPDGVITDDDQYAFGGQLQ
jgi:hypothetical protein